MPEKMKTEYEMNFSGAAQRKFNKFCATNTWTWFGLAAALIRRFGPSELEDFHYILGETIQKVKDSEQQ